jgi:hypothetical protein
MKSKDAQVFSGHYANQVYRTPQGGDKPVRDINEGEPDKFDITNTMTNKKFNYFNRLKSSFGQLSGETFSTFDYILDNKYVASDYNTFKKNYSGLGQHSLHSMNYGNQWSQFRSHSFNDPKRLLKMKQNEYSFNTIQSSISCQLDMTLNNTRRPGQLANILFKSVFKDTNVDQMMSGKWLIWGQIDSMTVFGGNAGSVVICIKDGFENLKNSFDLTPMTHLQPPTKL